MREMGGERAGVRTYAERPTPSRVLNRVKKNVTSGTPKAYVDG